MRAFKMDFSNRGVGGGLRGFQILAQAVTPSTRPPLVTICPAFGGAGVENLGVRQFGASARPMIGLPFA